MKKEKKRRNAVTENLRCNVPENPVLTGAVVAVVVKEGVVRGAVAVAAGAPNPEKPEALPGAKLSF